MVRSKHGNMMNKTTSSVAFLQSWVKLMFLHIQSQW